jgi:dihydrofolate synthase/folylpolyglutamate synthase
VVESPLVTAITSIAFDHIDMLGDSLGRIAREKAGIFKKGAPVVLGPLDPEADRAAEEVARSVGTGPLLRVARGRGPAEGWVVVGGGPDEIEIVPPPGFGRAIHTRLALAGRHQADNAAVAAMVALLLGARFEAIPAAVGRGLATARWPGRLERIERGEITVILDCAHNPHGARALAAALAEQGARPETTLLVFGALADKHWSEMLHILGPIAERRIYTSPQGRAPAAPSALAAICPGEVVERPGDAVERALAIARPGDRVVVAGSIYLVGEVRGALLGIDCDPIIAL